MLVAARMRVFDTPVVWVASGIGKVRGSGWTTPDYPKNEAPGFIAQIDPRSGEVLPTTVVPFQQFETDSPVAVGEQVWITDGAGTLTQVSLT
jgi:hypothetical protein